MAVLAARPVKTLMVLICMVAALLSPAAVRAQSDTPVQLQEHKIKAGLIYNFLKYTSWPADESSGSKTLDVCLLGGDPFDGYLYPLEGRTAQQLVIRIRQINSPSEAGNCHLIYINKDQSENVPELLHSLPDRNVLTVSDIHQFSSQGGMVEFSTQKDQRIHLYINRQAINDAGLSIESRLMKLAERGP